MIKEKYIELINKEIDRVNSPKDSNKLKEHLVQNAEAQQLYNDLKNISNMMCGVQDLEPPQDLKKQILNVIPKNKYAVHKKSQILKPLASALELKFNFNYVYAFSVGLIAGIIITSLLSSRIKFLDSSNLTGTLLTKNLSEKFKAGESVEINLNDVKGKIILKSAKDIILIELHLNSRPQVELEMSFNNEELAFNGFSHSSESAVQFRSDKNELRLSHQGFQKYNFLFKNRSSSDSPIKIKILSNGIVLFEKQLSPTF